MLDILTVVFFHVLIIQKVMFHMFHYQFSFGTFNVIPYFHLGFNEYWDPHVAQCVQGEPLELDKSNTSAHMHIMLDTHNAFATFQCNDKKEKKRVLLTQAIKRYQHRCELMVNTILLTTYFTIFPPYHIIFLLSSSAGTAWVTLEQRG